ncbi:MAG: S-layer homology domain-containing protein, partial [Clostridia bacterium]
DKDGNDLTGGYNTYLVQDKPMNVTLNGGKKLSVKAGSKTALELSYDDVQIYSYDGKRVSEADKVIYNVADTSVAEVRDGQLVGKKKGTTTLEVYIQPYGKMLEVPVTVTAKSSSSSSKTSTVTTTPDKEPEKETENKPVDEAKTVFEDVKETDWYYNAVTKATEMGIVNGTSEKTYSPDNELTRAMFATMLWRKAGSPDVSYAMSFKDVEDGQWYTEAVRWAASNGIVKGFDEETFGPDKSITREQAAAMLQRYSELAEESNPLWSETNILSYDDFDAISEWAIPAVQWAAGAGVMKGRTESTINPLENITRAETAQILVNYIESVENYKNEMNKED